MFVSDSTSLFSLSWNAISFLRVVCKVSIDAIVNSIFHSFFHSSGGWEGLSFAFGVLDLPTQTNLVGFSPPFFVWYGLTPSHTRRVNYSRIFPTALWKKRKKCSWTFPCLSNFVCVLSVACRLFAPLATTYIIVYGYIYVYMRLDIASVWKVPRFQRNFLVMNVVCTWFQRKINLSKLPAPPRAVLLVYRMCILS